MEEIAETKSKGIKMNDHTKPKRPALIFAEMMVESIVADCNGDRIRDESEAIYRLTQSGDYEGLDKITNGEWDVSLIYEIAAGILKDAVGYDVCLTLPSKNIAQHIAKQRKING